MNYARDAARRHQRAEEAAIAAGEERAGVRRCEPCRLGTHTGTNGTGGCTGGPCVCTCGEVR